MAKGVRARLVDVIAKVESISVSKAEDLVHKLQIENRFHQDVWS